MALLMLVATVWSVAQLTVLGSWSRTLRFSTLLLLVVLGVYACGPVAVVVQWVWTRLYAALTHTPLGTVVDTASYTVDPVIEEVVKVLPLVLLGAVLARVSRQLGLTDHLLVGAAVGAGFSLFESTMRFGTVKALAMSLGDGYIVQASLGGAVVVPGIGSSLTSWLPEPTSTEELLGPATGGITHLAWTALAGAGVGWFLRRSRPRRWWGVVPLAFACLDHMLLNYGIAHSSVGGALGALSTGVGWVHQRLGFVVLVAVVVTTVLDRVALSAAREAHTGVLLPGESPEGFQPRPLWAFARVAPPWTVLVAARFVLSRRAALYALSRDPTDTELTALVEQTREQMERADERRRWVAATRDVPHGLRAVLGTAGGLLRDWRVVLWLVVLVPSLLYLVVGGFPATRGLQDALRTTAGSWVLVACGATAVVLLVAQLVPMVRARRTVLASPSGEAVGRFVARLAVGVGAAVAGVVLIGAGVVGGAPGSRTLVSNVHALDALAALLVVLGLALVIWAMVMFPPFAVAVTSIGTRTLVLSITEALVLNTARGVAVAGVGGIYLSEAADGGGSGGGGLTSEPEPGPPPSRGFQERLDQAKAKLPERWGDGEPNRKVPGRRWQDPKDPGSGVRIDRGDPDSPFPSQRVDHVVVRDHGKVVGRDGRPIEGSIKSDAENAHIPLDEWLRWTTWNAP